MADDLKRLGDELVNALTTALAGSPLEVRIRKSDKFFLREQADAAPAKPKRLRSMSLEGTGRGRGRGAKPAAAKLLRLLKPGGRRADFVRFIGGTDTPIVEVMKRFDMTRANVNGFLTNIQRDHGIGYFKDNANVRLVLPARSTWKNIWG